MARNVSGGGWRGSSSAWRWATAFTQSHFVRHPSEGWGPSKACFKRWVWRDPSLRWDDECEEYSFYNDVSARRAMREYSRVVGKRVPSGMRHKRAVYSS